LKTLKEKRKADTRALPTSPLSQLKRGKSSVYNFVIISCKTSSKFTSPPNGYPLTQSLKKFIPSSIKKPCGLLSSVSAHKYKSFYQKSPCFSKGFLV
jgi:hypothetical protein